MDIYDKLQAANVPLDSHESDLYAKVTEVSKAIVATYESKDDIPFANKPWWKARQRG